MIATLLQRRVPTGLEDSRIIKLKSHPVSIQSMFIICSGRILLPWKLLDIMPYFIIRKQINIFENNNISSYALVILNPFFYRLKQCDIRRTWLRRRNVIVIVVDIINDLQKDFLWTTETSLLFIDINKRLVNM